MQNQNQCCETTQALEWEDEQAVPVDVEPGQSPTCVRGRKRRLLINETQNILVTVLAATARDQREPHAGMMLAISTSIGHRTAR
jgi:hypothetical protein